MALVLIPLVVVVLVEALAFVAAATAVVAEEDAVNYHDNEICFNFLFVSLGGGASRGSGFRLEADFFPSLVPPSNA